jgi:hypothetical protein
VRGLHDDRDPQRLDLLPDRFGDLVRQPLLDLQAPREDLDEPRDLAEADHLPVREVGDVAAAEERQQVVLAQAVEVDVADDHHLVVVDGEQRVVEHRIDVGLIAAREEAHAPSRRASACRAALRATGPRRAPRASPDVFLHDRSLSAISYQLSAISSARTRTEEKLRADS